MQTNGNQAWVIYLLFIQRHVIYHIINYHVLFIISTHVVLRVLLTPLIERYSKRCKPDKTQKITKTLKVYLFFSLILYLLIVSNFYSLFKLNLKGKVILSLFCRKSFSSVVLTFKSLTFLQLWLFEVFYYLIFGLIKIVAQLETI